MQLIKRSFDFFKMNTGVPVEEPIFWESKHMAVKPPTSHWRPSGFPSPPNLLEIRTEEQNARLSARSLY